LPLGVPVLVQGAESPHPESTARAILLFSQNTLLREQNRLVGAQVRLLRAQNKMVSKQVRLLTQQNEKIDDQLRLSARQTSLTRDQNRKIDQQTMVADAQKRGAFATELFAIVQDLANMKQTAEGLRHHETRHYDDCSRGRNAADVLPGSKASSPHVKSDWQ
jgi:hypothetical protein